MRNEQLEAWVLSIVDLVINGRRIEDSRVELKADWPDPKRAARRIAGHANAVESDSILWVVGLDERQGVTLVSPTDLANWLPQVEAEFDGLAPSLKDLIVPTSSGPVVALLFDVSRRPFVVKNAMYGQQGGGAVSLEVPWRRGTGIDSARRDELLRILVPRQVLPSVELREATAGVVVQSPVNPTPGYGPCGIVRSEYLVWSFNLTLYVTPHTTDRLVLPTHKAALTFACGSEEPRVATEFRFIAPHRMVARAGRVERISDSITVAASAGEAVLSGPGLLRVQAYHREASRGLPPTADLTVTLTVSPAGSDLRTETVFRLLACDGQTEQKRIWKA